MMAKVIANGLICGPHTYLHSGWNVMDGSLICWQCIAVQWHTQRQSNPTQQRGFSACYEYFDCWERWDRCEVNKLFSNEFNVRPYLLSSSVISRAPGLKLVVQTLLSSLRPIGHIVVICCTFFIIFGILGVQVTQQSTHKKKYRCNYLFFLIVIQRQVLLLSWAQFSKCHNSRRMSKHAGSRMAKPAIQFR